MSQLKSLLFSLKSGERLRPKLIAFLLKERSEIAAGKISAQKGTIRDAELAAMCFKRRMDEYNHDDPKTKDYFHPSQIGRCPRQLWFEAFNAPADSEPSGEDLLCDHLTFETGTYAHVMLQNLISRAGCLVKREVAIRCDVDRIIGHGDGILRLDEEKALLEIKTINSRGIEKLTAPKPEHIDQATVYCGKLKLQTAIFLYLQKDYPHKLKEYCHTFSVTHYKKLMVKIKAFQQAVKNRIMPPRISENPHKAPCSWCCYQSVCYSTQDQKAFLKKIKAK